MVRSRFKEVRARRTGQRPRLRAHQTTPCRMKIHWSVCSRVRIRGACGMRTHQNATLRSVPRWQCHSALRNPALWSFKTALDWHRQYRRCCQRLSRRVALSRSQVRSTRRRIGCAGNLVRAAPLLRRVRRKALLTPYPRLRRLTLERRGAAERVCRRRRGPMRRR